MVFHLRICFGFGGEEGEDGKMRELLGQGGGEEGDDEAAHVLLSLAIQKSDLRSRSVAATPHPRLHPPKTGGRWSPLPTISATTPLASCHTSHTPPCPARPVLRGRGNCTCEAKQPRAKTSLPEPEVGINALRALACYLTGPRHNACAHHDDCILFPLAMLSREALAKSELSCLSVMTRLA